MNKRGKVSTQNLLEIDVDAIVEEGKKRQKNKKKFFAIWVIAIAIIGITTFTIYQYSQETKRATAYEDAIMAQEIGDYEGAILLLQELGDYKDSIEQLQRAKFMQEITTSSYYKQITAKIESTFSKESYRYDISVEFPEENLVINGYVDLEFRGPTVFTIDELKSWENLTKIANNLCNQISDLVQKGELDISTTICMLCSSTNNLLYQVVDGNEIYSQIDINKEKENTVAAIYAQMLLYEFDKDYKAVCEYWDTESRNYFNRTDYAEVNQCYCNAKEKLVEPIYQEIKLLADNGKYQEACDYWAENNENGYYQLSDNKSLSNYYYYSLALQAYLGKTTFTPGELIDIDNYLEKVSPDFKDTLAYREEVLNIARSVIESFKHTGMLIGNGRGGYSQSSFEIIIGKTEAAVVVDNMSIKYTPSCIIEDGKLQYVTLEESGNVAYTLVISGNVLTATSSTGSSLEYYRAT